MRTLSAQVTNLEVGQAGRSAVAPGTMARRGRKPRSTRLRCGFASGGDAAAGTSAGDDSGLFHAAELYTVLCGEESEDERLWIGLFRVYERAGDLLGLGRAERQLRQSLAELAPTNVSVNPDTVTLPPKLDRLLQQIRVRLG